MSENITITAANANRYFSKLLRQVREGARVTITSHGHVVAEMGPPAAADGQRERAKALTAMERRWADAEPMVVGPFSPQVRR